MPRRQIGEVELGKERGPRDRVRKADPATLLSASLRVNGRGADGSRAPGALLTVVRRTGRVARRSGSDAEETIMLDGAPGLAPIALLPEEGEALWAFGFLATLKASSETTDGRVAVIEHLGPRGAGSPLHVHHREDEWFYVLEGNVTFWVGGQVVEGSAGSFVYGPRDIPHTFVVASEVARFLLVSEPAGFDAFFRAAAAPAARPEIPPPPTEAPDIAGLTALAATFGIEIVGPPGIPA